MTLWNSFLVKETSVNPEKIAALDAAGKPSSTA
jgi:hypothetical protein